MRIDISYNGLGECDWCVVELNGKIVYAGNSRIHPSKLLDILERCNGFTDINYQPNLTDTEIEAA